VWEIRVVAGAQAFPAVPIGLSRTWSVQKPRSLPSGWERSRGSSPTIRKKRKSPWARDRRMQAGALPRSRRRRLGDQIRRRRCMFRWRGWRNHRALSRRYTCGVITIGDRACNQVCRKRNEGDKFSVGLIPDCSSRRSLRSARDGGGNQRRQRTRGGAIRQCTPAASRLGGYLPARLHMSQGYSPSKLYATCEAPPSIEGSSLGRPPSLRWPIASVDRVAGKHETCSAIVSTELRQVSRTKIRSRCSPGSSRGWLNWRQTPRNSPVTALRWPGRRQRRNSARAGHAADAIVGLERHRGQGRQAGKAQ